MKSDTRVLDHPGRLARSLAELRLRLRPSLSGRGRIPADLPALKVTAALLPVLADRAPGLTALGRELDRLLVGVEEDPSLWPSHLDPALGDLARFLDEVIASADEGLRHLPGLPGWSRQLAIWQDAGTPREIFHDLDRTLGAWRDRWQDPSVRREASGILEAGWTEFRTRGDSAFLPQVGTPDEVEASGRRGSVILLLDGPFRRDQLLSRLDGEGYEPVPVADPQAAAGLEEELRPVAILADNLAPHHNLANLTGLRGSEPEDCPLVLVSSGSGPLGRENARAQRLGARAAWCDPFHAPDLKRILQQPSHP